MDLYDYIKCDARLPGNPPLEVEILAQHGVAVTRSLGCETTAYTITADGDLLRTEYECEIVPEEQRYFWGKPEWELSEVYCKIGMRRRKIVGETKLADYQGVIAFSVMTAKSRVYFYIACFINGKLHEIKQVGGVR